MSDIKETIITAIKILKRNEIDSAPLDAELLLSYVLKKSKEFLYTYPDYQLTKAQLKKFKQLISRRIKYEPIAYLIGYKEFYGLKFIVNKHVLIPRPLSEQIIDNALKIIENKFLIRDTRYMICDIGTGSGCLIITLAKKLQEQKIINQFKLYATDISARALKVAQKNAQLHQVKKHITFLKGDLLKPLIKELALNAKGGRVDLIMANLPYLTKTDVKKESSIKKEPQKALVGDFYSKLFKQIKRHRSRPIIIYEDKDGISIKSNPYL